MHYKKWLKISLITIFATLTINSLFLYLTDIYGVGHPNRKTFPTAFHQRFLVVEYMLQHLHDYDTLLFGSSRVQFINPFHIPNAKAYNMTVAEGIPKEYYLMLKLFIERDMKPKMVLIGLDNYSYNLSYQEHQTALETKIHYLASKESPFEFYSNFYFRKPTKRDFQDIQNRSKGLNLYKLHYDIIYHQKEAFEHQHYTQPKPDAPIYNDPTTWHGDHMDEALEDIQNIKKLCDANHIKCIFFINPIQHTSYKVMNKQMLQEFKERLAKITDFYDFTLPNEISNDNRNWLETSHFIPKIGDLILKTIFENKVFIKNFGIHVKKEKN